MIVGDIGYRDHMVFTALGDAVNVAARLQDMTKSLACEAVISEEVRAIAGLRRCAPAHGRRDPRHETADDRAHPDDPTVLAGLLEPQSAAAAE